MNTKRHTRIPWDATDKWWHLLVPGISVRWRGADGRVYNTTLVSGRDNAKLRFADGHECEPCYIEQFVGIETDDEIIDLEPVDYSMARKRALLRTEVETLVRQIAKEESNCRHEFGDPISDPAEEPRFEFSHFKPCGSDPEPVYHIAGTKFIPRWKRVCVRCGKVEHTSKTKTVKSAPDFG